MAPPPPPLLTSPLHLLFSPPLLPSPSPHRLSGHSLYFLQSTSHLLLDPAQSPSLPSVLYPASSLCTRGHPGPAAVTYPRLSAHFLTGQPDTLLPIPSSPDTDARLTGPSSLTQDSPLHPLGSSSEQPAASSPRPPLAWHRRLPLPEQPPLSLPLTFKSLLKVTSTEKLPPAPPTAG